MQKSPLRFEAGDFSGTLFTGVRPAWAEPRDIREALITPCPRRGAYYYFFRLGNNAPAASRAHAANPALSPGVDSAATVPRIDASGRRGGHWTGLGFRRSVSVEEEGVTSTQVDRRVEKSIVASLHRGKAMGLCLDVSDRHAPRGFTAPWKAAACLSPF